MRECEGEHADVPVWPPRGVPQVLRQDHPSGRFSEGAASPLRHLPHQDRTSETFLARSGHAGHTGSSGFAVTLRGPWSFQGSLLAAAGPRRSLKPAAGKSLPP